MRTRSGSVHGSRLPSHALGTLRRRPIVRALREACARRGRSSWIVGGALRDALLGLPVHEIDAALDGDPEPLARDLEAARRGRAVFLSRDRPGPRVFRVAAAATELDLAALEGDSIEEDLARRDFTVNAMALPVAGGPLIDPIGGARDLARGALRGVRERNFHEDPLRALRAARLMATRRLTPDAQLFAWARGAATGLEAVAPERVSSELGKLLAETRVAPALRWAARAGILGAALGVQLPPASARALARAAAALDGPRVGSLPGPSRRRIRLAWLAVRLGFEPRAARKWLAGRRWPGREAEEVAGLVSLAARAAEAPTGDDAWRWILDAGALVEDAAALAAVLGRGRRSAAAAERLLRLARGPRLSLRVSGRDVMEWTGLPPGPRIGELLDRLALASAAGRVRTRRDAKRWLLVETDAASS